MSHNLPLYHFFTMLRGHKDFNLGLEEYFSLIEVFQQDEKYIKDAQELLNLCRFLWLKPGQSENLFVGLFKQSFEWTSKSDINDSMDDQDTENATDEQNDKDEPSSNLEDTSDNQEGEDFDQEKVVNEQETEDLYLNIINKNVGKSISTTSEEDLIQPYKIHLLDNYVLLKERQLKQRWRSLKKFKAGASSSQINVPATIQQIAQKGVFLQPVYQSKKVNTASLLTLVDNQGSMVAFKGICKALLETATKGAKIENTVYYFKNVPKINDTESDFYLYHSPAHTRYSQLIIELGRQLHKQKDLAILIISDAGAARGNLSLERFNSTVEILKVLKYFSFKIVWLNPVPKDRWTSTTASLIADYVPMFEANEYGLKEAIEILRGKNLANTRMFYEETTLE